MVIIINNDWNEILSNILNSNKYLSFLETLKIEYATNTVFPDKKDLFSALNLTPYKDVKVVIIGQDPYHGEGEAHGLAFSVKDGVKIPPSLKNIFKELYNDLGIEIPKSGNLIPWAKEGVLLINTTLSVIKDQANSHKLLGWEILTDEIIKKLNDKQAPVVFILWGNFAKSKKKLITNEKHLIIESVHPSPLSSYNGFFGSKPFSKTNNFLLSNNVKTINWKL